MNKDVSYWIFWLVSVVFYCSCLPVNLQNSCNGFHLSQVSYKVDMFKGCLLSLHVKYSLIMAGILTEFCQGWVLDRILKDKVVGVPR